MSSNNKILFVTRHCYLDNSNGAAVSSRELIQVLARRGFSVEVLSSITMDLAIDVNPVAWFTDQGWSFEDIPGHSWSFDVHGIRAESPPHLRLIAQGVPVVLHRGTTTGRHEPDEVERREFIQLFDIIVSRFRPDVVVGYGGDRLQSEVFAHARRQGCITVFNLHNFRYGSINPFKNVNALRVPSHFSANYYHQALGLECSVIPNPVQRDRIEIRRREPKYLTFVNPSVEKGVYAFARIADELGRKRPDIPLLVVESRGTEEDVAACGLDLRCHGNVYFMSHTHDPCRFYRVSRAMLMPSLMSESFGRIAAEAMCNGIPVVASNRGALPETLGGSGIILSLPERMTRTTKILPMAEELTPWVEAIIRLWDDSEYYNNLSRRATAEAERWDPETLEPQYVRFFRGLELDSNPFEKAPSL
jgi:glycosyltransferase involved in cell wall biosynthesis